MKKLLVVFCAIFFGSLVNAQDGSSENDEVVNKKGISILPKAGDFAIGVDASPFINLIGNIVRINDFTGPFNDPSSFNFVDGSSIYVKYFLTDKSAVRARIDIMMFSQTINNSVPDDLSADPYVRVKDSWEHSENAVNLALGYELRRGKGRIQAFYGGEMNFNFGGKFGDKYSWGNVLDNTNNFPTTTVNWNTNSFGGLSNRILERSSKSGFGIGLKAFVGVEYFIFPKISLGGEFGWGFSYNTSGDEYISSEAWNFVDGIKNSGNYTIQGSKGFSMGNENLGGNIFVLIHF